MWTGLMAVHIKPNQYQSSDINSFQDTYANIRGRNIQRAIDAVKEKGVDTDLELYDKIEKMPGENIYKLSKVMGWSPGKTYTAARRLEGAGMVYVEKAEKNGRLVFVVRPKVWQEYFTPEELEEFKRMEI